MNVRHSQHLVHTQITHPFYFMDRRSALKILDLGSTASAVEIKRNYRKLAARYHPDRHAGNPRQVEQAGQKMQELNGAYTYLLTNIAENNAPKHPNPEHLFTKIITFPRFISVFLAFIIIAAGGLLLYTLKNRPEKNRAKNTTSLIQPASTQEERFLNKKVNQLSHLAVQELQQGLATLRYDIGVVDGFMGPKTLAGLRSYCADFALLHPCSSVANAQKAVALHATVVQSQPEWKNIVQDKRFHRWLMEQGETQHLQAGGMQAHELVSLIDQYRFTAAAPSSQPLPTTGVLWQERKPLDSTRLILDASAAGKYHFFIKLIQSNNKQDVLYGFIRGGEQWSIALPPGDHQLKVAAGHTWHGKQYLFGPGTKTLLLSLQGAAGHALILQSVDMNKLIQTSQISPAGSIFDF